MPLLNTHEQIGPRKFAARVKRHLRIEKKDELLAKIQEFRRRPIIDLHEIEEANETEES